MAIEIDSYDFLAYVKIMDVYYDFNLADQLKVDFDRNVAGIKRPALTPGCLISRS
jgi:hypothetical protein